ncbi:hypothetical protein A4H97_14760 [Niastella yeongjuensis]|uniref:Uncharacterized protein n=2 Tax=Niastella yeongjuensis TaxID=354355 RepID=A0A1V9E408_9BACT|nr:hypothetical protein A4H97_14760 [Niastella yeongjuensis]
MIALSSCSVYRSGQTPDDVYFSPAPTADDSYVTVNNTKRGSRYDNSNPEDNYLSMRQYGSRWNQFDDYNDWQYNGGYYGGYSPYTPYSSFGPSFYGGYGGYGGGFYGGYGIGMPYAMGFYNPWAINTYNPYFNSYYYWNSYYNPYAGGIIVGGSKGNPVAYKAVRNFNMSSYTNRTYSTRNTSNNRPIYTNPNGRYNTSNNNGNTSGGLRRSNDSYYSPGQRSTPTYTPSSAPVRTYSPSSGGSYGGSSGGGGGSSPSRPSRGH